MIQPAIPSNDQSIDMDINIRNFLIRFLEKFNWIARGAFTDLDFNIQAFFHFKHAQVKQFQKHLLFTYSSAYRVRYSYDNKPL